MRKIYGTKAQLHAISYRQRKFPKNKNPRPVQFPSLKAYFQVSLKYPTFLGSRPKYDHRSFRPILDFLNLLFSFLRFQHLVEFGFFHFGRIQNLILNPQRIFDQFGLGPNSVLFLFFFILKVQLTFIFEHPMTFSFKIAVILKFMLKVNGP